MKYLKHFNSGTTIFCLFFPDSRLHSEPYSSITWQVVLSQVHVIAGAVFELHVAQGSVLKFQFEIFSLLAIIFKESTVREKQYVKDEKQNIMWHITWKQRNQNRKYTLCYIWTRNLYSMATYCGNPGLQALQMKFLHLGSQLKSMSE